MTENAWRRLMREQGWRYVHQGWWQHENGAKFYGWNVKDAQKDAREQWRIYAEAGETPPPF